jgi:ribosome maturation factor RimP
MSARPQGRRPDPARRAEVVALLEPVVAAAGFDLEDVELRSVGRRTLVRVLVDGENGITLDDIATVSQAVSDSLDADDPLGDEPYTLEVSSPGVDRPLTLPRHWRRNVGRLVAVTLTDGTQLTARLTAVDDTSATLETDTKGRKATRTVPLASVARAVVEVEFSRAAAADGLEAGTDDDLAADDDRTDDELDVEGED